ncbi:hypothetical protein N7495_002855 [Penicillium taxi]|uniref:uncharacterized protein n=1 Tax=Penicillium taxi TaxID=168475 RepID=UPI0025457CDA|nr:uncharacterized protein N7495_002855 [Penicillium taxi]KAJ5902327.1 hypothetical protein N7495_002855 [Penicillium taxi]
MMFFTVALLGLFLQIVTGQRHDADLMSFVTLPEVRALKWEITHLDREREAPGYWFVAPYGVIVPELPSKKYSQFQVGPYIYDSDGMLIWAGSEFTDNRNAYDFRTNIDDNGDIYLSFLLDPLVQFPKDSAEKSRGMVLDKHYNVTNEVRPTADIQQFNMHEFKIMPGGLTALTCIYHPVSIDLDDFGRPSEQSWVISGGFAEFNIATNEILLQWNSIEHVALFESNKLHPWDSPATDPLKGWDYAHVNAVDQNADGDYILSMRFTNTIYFISGDDGRVLWRLGGHTSDFDMDFTFSKQHDAKFVFSNGTHHQISFLNNASDEDSQDESLSSVLYVDLDTEFMTARVAKRINRPDAGLTRLRGSAETLPNGNSFISWSEHGYQSEHAPNGDLLMTAQFASDRYSTYRAYKSEFIGRPLTPPVVVASAYGISSMAISTVIHVSWNGATDVAGWKFYAKAYDHGDSVFIGHTDKTDFETMYIIDGYMDWVTAEAIDQNGTSMMKSVIVRTVIPDNWNAAGFLSAQSPRPDDPAVLYNTKQALIESHASSNTSIIDPATTNTTIEDSHDMDDLDFIDDSTSSEPDEPSSLENAKEIAQEVHRAFLVIHAVGAMLIALLGLCALGGIVVVIIRLIHRYKTRSYQHVFSDEEIPTEEIRMLPQSHE